MDAARYSFRVEPSPAGGWTIWYPDLPGCMGWAETPEAIGSEALTIAELWIEAEQERNHPIPAPVDHAAAEKWPQGHAVVAVSSAPLIGVPDAAKLLGLSERRVHAIATRRGIGRRLGRALIFTEADIEQLRPGPPGRPRKNAALPAD